MKAAFVMFAAYNQWANNLLLEECAQLDEADYHRDLGVYFNSIHGTLDHQLVADRLWLYRFTGEGEAYDSLDDTLTGGFADLREKRKLMDERIISVIDRMQERDFMRTLIYRTVRKPLVMQQPLGAALFHFFNHQTHHRGQVHGMLTQLGRTPEAVDMIYFQRETGLGMAREEDMVRP
ncbi:MULTISPECIES: DinB family protein [Pseudovibrio]|uniref:DinB family protein n=1 Tax=Stappiaceae TaxID=2821832 RepID=UPI002365DD2F|nr:MULTISPECIES: DinB family protein [Pseudovibrio]MDD7908895.1 DinB family protein [Pseudovibrio exalbescens]MDX5593784.1 DinB family protein [Pseudovibrio sp. SPO723]